MAEFIEKTDTLNEGREKINAAIQDAEDAKTTAGQAVNVSEQAKLIAQTAENKADNVQEQFNQVVIEGDSSVEAAQARVDAEGKSYPTLKARLDAKETEFSSQLAQIEYIPNPNGDGTTDDTHLIQDAINQGYTKLLINPCLIDSVQLKDNQTYKITFNGNIKHIDSASDDMFKSGQNTKINVYGNNYTVDGNFQQQSNRVSLFNITGASSFVLFNLYGRNIKNKGIIGRQTDLKLIHIANCHFLDADLHSGIRGEGTGFVNIYGGDFNIFEGCTFKHSETPRQGENRNPGGIFISGSNPNKVVTVRDCEFDNLGHNVAGNLESPLDIYAYAKQVILENNSFKRSRFNPFRVTNAGITRIVNNEVIQDVPILNDGGTLYPDACCFNGGIVGRGYTVNDINNELYQIENNVFRIIGVECRGITISSDSSTKFVEKFILKNNKINKDGGNTQIGVFILKTKESILENNTIVGFAGAVRIQNTDVDGLSNERAKLTILGGEYKGVTGVHARTNVSNLDVSIKNVDLYEITTHAFTIRNADNVEVSHCVLPVNNSGDASNNKSFFYYNNTPNYNADPAGYNTNEYYRLYNNIGRNDVSSE